ETARDPLVQLLHALDAKAACAALIGDGRVDVAVGDHGLPGLEGGPDHLLDQARARGTEQERLGDRRELDVRALYELANPLRGGRPPRLPNEQGLLAERLREQLRLGRLPRAVDSLEGDEHART